MPFRFHRTTAYIDEGDIEDCEAAQVAGEIIEGISRVAHALGSVPVRGKNIQDLHVIHPDDTERIMLLVRGVYDSYIDAQTQYHNRV